MENSRLQRIFSSQSGQETSVQGMSVDLKRNALAARAIQSDSQHVIDAAQAVISIDEEPHHAIVVSVHLTKKGFENLSGRTGRKATFTRC